MKLATYQDGSRDGQLVVVSRDLASAHYATGVATRLQAVLDDWNFLSPQLQDLSDELNAGRARHAFAFDPARCMAPLPRAHAHAEGGAYTHHALLIRRSAASPQAPAVPATPEAPAMRRLGGELLGAQDDMLLPPGTWQHDFEAGLAVVTGDIPQGCTPERAIDGVRLVMLAHGLALRPAGGDADADAGFHARPATAFSPVAVTTDELGAAWVAGRLSGVLQTVWNGRKVGLCDTGPDMDFPFGRLIADMARTARLRAGTVVGTGAVSNPAAGDEGARDSRRGRKGGTGATPDWPRGYSSIAEKRAMETVQDGAAKTAYLQAHDTLRIEMKGRDGLSIFGAIAQEFLVQPKDVATD